MNFLILIACAFVAYKSYKAKSPLGFAGAGALLGLAYAYEGWMGFFQNIFIAVAYRSPLLIVPAAIAFGGSYVYFKGKGQLRPSGRKFSLKRPDDLTTDMRLMVGRILDTKNSHVVLSDTHVHQNAMGHLDSYTTHDVRVSHNTWLYDINRDKEVNYAGSGKLHARAGHIFGVMSWKGQSFLDTNFSTGISSKLPATPVSLLVSLVWGAALTVFGPLLFPLFMLMSPLVWLGWIGWAGNGGAFTKNVLPSTHRLEALLTYGGGLAYGIAFLYMASTRFNGDAVSTALICIFVLLVCVHQYVVKNLNKEYDELISKGEEELQRLYTAGMAHQAAKAGAPASNDPVATPAVAS